MVRNLQIASLTCLSFPVPCSPLFLPLPFIFISLTGIISRLSWRWDLDHTRKEQQSGRAHFLCHQILSSLQAALLRLPPSRSPASQAGFFSEGRGGTWQMAAGSTFSSLDAHPSAERARERHMPELLTLPAEGKLCSFVGLVLKREHK